MTAPVPAPSNGDEKKLETYFAEADRMANAFGHVLKPFSPIFDSGLFNSSCARCTAGAFIDIEKRHYSDVFSGAAFRTRCTANHGRIN